MQGLAVQKADAPNRHQRPSTGVKMTNESSQGMEGGNPGGTQDDASVPQLWKATARNGAPFRRRPLQDVMAPLRGAGFLHGIYRFCARVIA